MPHVIFLSDLGAGVRDVIIAHVLTHSASGVSNKASKLNAGLVGNDGNKNDITPPTACKCSPQYNERVSERARERRPALDYRTMT